MFLTSHHYFLFMTVSKKKTYTVGSYGRVLHLVVRINLWILYRLWLPGLPPKESRSSIYKLLYIINSLLLNKYVITVLYLCHAIRMVIIYFDSLSIWIIKFKYLRKWFNAVSSELLLKITSNVKLLNLSGTNDLFTVNSVHKTCLINTLLKVQWKTEEDVTHVNVDCLSSNRLVYWSEILRALYMHEKQEI